MEINSHVRKSAVWREHSGNRLNWRQAPLARASCALCRCRLVSSRSVSRAIVRSSRSSSPLPSFWSSVSRAIVFFSRFLPFLSDDDKDHDEITKVRRLLSLSAELSSALLALSPLFPPSGRLSAELSSSFLAFSPFSPTTIRTTTTSLRFGVFPVCQPSYRLLFSLSLPSSLLLVVCQPSYRLLFSLSPLSPRRR